MNFPKKLFQFYWSVIKKFPFYFSAVFVLGVITYFLDMVLFPYVNKWAFEIFELAGNPGNSERIKTLMWFLILNYVALLVFRLLESFIKGRMQPIINRYAGFKLYNRVYGNDTDFFINRPAGQIANKADEVRNNLSPLTVDFWKDMIGLTIGFFLIVGTLLTMNVWLSVFVLVCGIVRAAWTFIMQKPINKVSKELVDVSSDISGTRTDSLGNFMTARLFANEKYENKYIYNKQDKQVCLNQKKSFLSRLQNIPSMGIFLVLQMGIVVACFMLISDGSMTIADAAFAFVGGRAVAGMFSDVTGKVASFFENRAKAKHAYEDIMQDQAIVDAENAKSLKITRAEIDFEKVSFDYGNKDVIKNFNLHLDKGEKIGVVGLSGAGKTTLVNLILRLYDVKAGAIKIDGQDLRVN
jgi:ABC-type multidrug transport system fused ATPase/permease subunit